MSTQLIKQSYLLADYQTQTANQVQAVENPLSRGMSADLRIDSLDLFIGGKIKDKAGNETHMHFDNESEVLGFYDALYSNIRLSSGTLGDVIRNLSLGEVVKAVQFLNGDFPDSTLPKPGRNQEFCTVGGDGEFQAVVRIPFNLAAPAIRASYAPRASQFPDGGLAVTTGSLEFTTTSHAGASVTWEIDSTTPMEWRMRGPELPMESKISPILYEKYTNTGIAEFPQGAYLQLFQNTDSPKTAYGTSGGASAGFQVDADGDTIIYPSNYNPLNALSSLIQESSDPAAFELDAAFEQSEYGTGTSQGVFARVGTPILNVDYGDSSYNIPVVAKRLVVQPGSNLTTGSVDYIACRVRPLDQVGDAPRCGAGISGSGVPLPAPAGPTSPAIKPFLGKQE